MLDQETRTEIQQSIRRALQSYPDVLDATKGRAVTGGDVAALFAMAAANGWLVMSAPEEGGGMGLGLSGATLLAIEIGRAVAPGPFMASALLARSLSVLLGADLRGGLAEGSRILTVGTRSGFDGDTRYIVEHAAGATDVLLVDEAADGGLEVRIVHAPTLSMLDPFDPIAPVGTIEESAVANESHTTLARQQAEHILGEANLWIGAELLGIAQRTVEMAITHAGERKQFGQPIGAYQGVKHRIVDNYVTQQNAAAILSRATQAWDLGAADRVMLAHAARAAASEAALGAAAHCIQVHGGMGFSWEHPAHLYYKRARRLVNLFGSEGESRAALGRALCEMAG